MPTTKRDLQALQYLAQRLRQETVGAGPWHDNGLTAILSKLEGHNLAISIERITRHAADPDAKTPAAIERPFTPEGPTMPARFPAKAGDRDECWAHPGEWANACRACAADAKAGDEPRPVVRQKPPAEVAVTGAAACRAAAGLPERLAPESSPAPDVAASGEPPAPPPAVSSVDEGDDHGPASAGEPDRPEVTHRPEVTPATHVWGERGPEALVPRRVDDRPETACAADGCYRPTRDGICERCRAAAIAEDIDAGNTALIAQLKDQQRRRLAPTPSAPGYFTSAHYDPERVHAAQARAAQQRSNT